MNKHLLRLFILSAIVISTTALSAQKRSVHVTGFTVNNNGKKVVIDWKTDGAIATNYFAIQKSVDGVNYKTIALVLGPDPKQKGCDCYGCSDKYIPAKHSY